MKNVVASFKETLLRRTDLPAAVAAIYALTLVIEKSTANTMTEFTIELEEATNELQVATKNAIAVLAGCELFKRFVTRTAGDVIEEFDRFKKILINRGHIFTERAPLCREKIAALSFQFITHDSSILVHSYSRSVMSLLIKAAAEGRNFTVYVTEARPASSGILAVKALKQAGIPAFLITDTSVGYYMTKVDMVLVGAEGVVETGGIINQIGTYQIGVMAKAAKKPVYAVVESYKFVRLFPLNQDDLPSSVSCKALFVEDEIKTHGSDLMDVFHPSIDYTPPEFITLLFTDFGILTPSGVSDELIKLYY